MATPGQFTLRSQNLRCLPIVNFFLARMDLADHLQAYLPHDDDRVGRTLDRLFDTDRASLITETVLQVIRDFGVEVAQLP